MSRIRIPFRPKPFVAVIRLSGVIGGGGRIGGGGLNDAGLATQIERAFGRGKPKAVALVINSPGGSPTQSALIAARIRRLADEKSIPVFAFCEDVAASGGYWLATAADEIFVDDNTIMGSIGVISSMFGFQELIKRHGIERRVHTAGESKSFLDPFLDENPTDVARLKHIQTQIHDNFVRQVTVRRGHKISRADIFDGTFWIGQDAVDLGLADGVGHLVPTMKDRFGDKITFNIATPKKSLFQRLGMPGGAELLASVEDRLEWARYGR